MAAGHVDVKTLARRRNTGAGHLGAVRLLAVLVAGLAAGCSVLEEPAPRQLEGRTDGYQPTASFLKVMVRDNATGDLLLAAFAREDWAVSRVADRLDHKQLPYLVVATTPRAIPGEYEVERVIVPPEVDALRYTAMRASPEEKRLLDAEYDALLARLRAPPAVEPGGSVPGGALPAPP